MQIENHKEEVPFGHYEELFRNADAGEMASRTGVKWDGKEFYVNLLGVEYAISHPKYEIRECPTSVSCADTSSREEALEERIPRDARNDSGCGVTGHSQEQLAKSKASRANCQRPLAVPVQTFLLRYLLEGKKIAWQGSFKTFRQMPWGELYIKPYTGRVLTRAAFTFGTRLDAFKAACEKMGAKALPHGDAGYELELLRGYRMQVLVWEGDEEFPPNAQVLYSDNFETGFAPEDRVVAGDILITAIKGNM